MKESTAVVALVLTVLACATSPARRARDAVYWTAASMARRENVLVLVVFFAGLLSSALPSLLGMWPVPAVHDEFAYLLAADTFAHGRVTNPPHKHWEHFETFHTIHQPSYMAKFPPAQGVALAAGQVLTGRPRVGAWLIVSAACAATAWMIAAIAPPRWALAGGLLAVVHQTMHWFGQTYWGGGAAMLGGALLGGGAARIMLRAGFGRVRSTFPAGMTMGAGIGILALSRPFEGLIVTLGVMTYLSIVVARSGGLAKLMIAVFAPAAIILVPFAAALGYYNWRVTGSALTMPYSTHARQYMAAPLMYFEFARPAPAYRHAQLRNFHTQIERAEYERFRNPSGYVKAVKEDLATLARAYIRPIALLIPLAAAMLAIKRRSCRLAVLVCATLPIVHVLLTPWMRIQYMAPAAPFFFARLVVGLRELWRRRAWGVRWGGAVAAAVVIVQVYTGVSFAISYNRRDPPAPGAARAKLIHQLQDQPGKHLVIVRYGPAHSPIHEWVFNGADIDASRIVFARQTDAHGDQSLLDYFKDRHVWALDVENDRMRLTPLR
jgi:hypothetical protein